MFKHPLAEVVVWVVLLAAAFVDIATFHQVLLLVMTNATTGTVWGVAIGFVAVALALAHYVGGRAKLSLTPGTATTTTIGAGFIAWICFGIWSALGLISCLIRFLINDGGGRRHHVCRRRPGGRRRRRRRVRHEDVERPHVPGAVRSDRRALRPGRLDPPDRGPPLGPRRRDAGVVAEHRHATAQADSAYAQQLLGAIEQERNRRDTDLTSAMRWCDAAASGLKQEIRLKLRRPRTDQT